jgi:hypothetical protein
METTRENERGCLRGRFKGVIRKITGETKSILYASLKKLLLGMEPPFREEYTL